MEIALDMEYPIHKPVMVREAMKFLRPHSNGIYVDATLGLVGHTKAILECANSHAKFISLDIANEALHYNLSLAEGGLVFRGMKSLICVWIQDLDLLRTILSMKWMKRRSQRY